ncbi:MAG: mannose-1-phosphate guanylyltransferase/mannose-6-phosphate isomerase [Calditerrivibrio sp.]|nr:mannose-1-phosphate guanylyltransferase/mannose-6-phosphate isomerase [Calditerrivibrio sp.]
MKIIILSGGGGTRLFPLSRERFPKQFLPLFDGESLLQKTVKRSLKSVDVKDIIILTNKDHIFHIKNQLKEFTSENDIPILLEPVRRNTAPAIALGVLYLIEKDKVSMDEPILVLPSDHLITPDDKFLLYVNSAADIAAQGYIATFGIKPSKPETGYGYIEIDSNIRIGEGFRIERFHEKPSFDRAIEYLHSGKHFWNSGMFCFTAKVFLEELKLYSSEIYEKVNQLSYEEVLENFSEMPDISIDYAIMEKTEKAAVLPMDIEWSDVGSFEALYDVLKKDHSGNAVKGTVSNISSKNNLIIADSRHVFTIGVEDLIVVETDDTVLIAKKGEGQRVKDLVNHLKKGATTKVLTEIHTTDYRPWGKFTLLDEEDRFKIKRITVSPNESLSLQMHYHRSEHWIVVKGTALVVFEDEEGQLKEKFVRENESLYIPKTMKHRLINPGKVPLEIIEVQVGEYVGEDDIVRFEDRYKRN